ncbi:DNA gyrase/topoisomerase IV subunit A [Alistipes sp.]|uniref:DNA gyrase/topoisomerase IV subunit A n=1 Tax=Alistipes sp. TaxID=1872444 RepID=UPI001F8F2D54|nr:DNA gyrase/topoisomerase IV subunit A [Alistipes sp.]HJC75980.1 DNA gyrase/topoisomerase IV subunit A [Candidatus Alistipes excrementavium]
MAEERDTNREREARDEASGDGAAAPEAGAAEGGGQTVRPQTEGAPAGRYDRLTQDEGSVRKLTGMYKNWFLDYASYVILERAVPHIADGLKPVQRRILHAMKSVDDGRYNKVANIVGQTMQYHPHGDASIKDALVQLGQKELLIDCQGNWGNVLTGDEAAAGRYIEARLSKFALDVVFNKKTTEWMRSYDGRNEEPVTLPIKFPLLLAQGSDGIAVGLASKILPHNFNELIHAAIAHLQGREFRLFPDFPTGGLADVSRYNDGLRGGAVKVRARISKIDKRTLAITEIPYTTTTESIKESIIKANDKGKIKIRRVDDNTAEKVEIIIHVANDESSDKTIDALYAFTDCEVSISPNACVIYDEKPHFLGVSEMLRRSAEHTRCLLGRELEIRLDELNEAWHAASLERIFIENKLYALIEGCTTREEAYKAVDAGLEPFKGRLRRAVTLEDVQRLTELKFIRISRYDSDKADNEIRQIEADIEQTQYHLAHLTEYAVAYFERIRDKYGKGKERRTELREFDCIEATKVAVTNAKLYVDRAEGFFGIGKSMKDAEFVCDCSDIDDVIVFTRDGRYVITKVSDKAFFDKNIYYIGVFKRNDERTIYNLLYRDGKNGPIMMKRCAIKGITRDKEYDITKGTPKSEILYMSVNPNGEAEVLKVYFKPRPRLKKVIVDLDFSTLAIKGRQSQGNLFSRYGIHKIVLKERGASTLGGQDIWYDEEVRRLNADGRGVLLGEFEGDDRLIVWTSKNQYYITGYELSQHFPDETVRVEKYEPDRIYALCYYDAEQKYYYLKRFTAEASERMQFFLDEEGAAEFVAMTGAAGTKLRIAYKGAHASRPADEIDVDEFIGVKSHRAKGKRLTTYEVDSLAFIEPEPPTEAEPDEAPGGGESGPEGPIGFEAFSANAERAEDRDVANGSGASDVARTEDTRTPDRDAGSGGAAHLRPQTGGGGEGAQPVAGSKTAGHSKSAGGGRGTALGPVFPNRPKEEGGVEFEIERAVGDADRMIDPEQLNLF